MVPYGRRRRAAAEGLIYAPGIGKMFRNPPTRLHTRRRPTMRSAIRFAIRGSRLLLRTPPSTILSDACSSSDRDSNRGAANHRVNSSAMAPNCSSQNRSLMIVETSAMSRAASEWPATLTLELPRQQRRDRRPAWLNPRVHRSQHPDGIFRARSCGGYPTKNSFRDLCVYHCLDSPSKSG